MCALILGLIVMPLDVIGYCLQYGRSIAYVPVSAKKLTIAIFTCGAILSIVGAVALYLVDRSRNRE